MGSEMHLCTHWGDGAKGAESLARAVRQRIDARTAAYRPLYPDNLRLADKIRMIAHEIYRAEDIDLASGVAKKLESYEKAGFGHVPVCIAKTQYSFSSDPTKLGAPTGHTLTVRDVRLSAGAGFVVAICGDIMTMPGLPRVPAAETITLNDLGGIEGLF
jgi:formate--tetrahydrofolate ligase